MNKELGGLQHHPSYILPEWPVPDNIKSVITTRLGGYSQGPYQQFNLGAHVEDSPQSVTANREQLYSDIHLDVHWLNQVHDKNIIEFKNDIPLNKNVVINADGATSCALNKVCAVQTADCLPILLCDLDGTQVAALHAGWRGLAKGIITEGVKCFSKTANIMAYLGPAIGPNYFEVGEEVKKAFECAQQQRQYSEDTHNSFVKSSNADRFLCDIYRLARSELEGAGVSKIYGGSFCTYSDKETFFSYRRDGQTGRMASLIWLE